MPVLSELVVAVGCCVGEAIQGGGWLWAAYCVVPSELAVVAVGELVEPSELASGCGRGADLARAWAIKKNHFTWAMHKRSGCWWNRPRWRLFRSAYCVVPSELVVVAVGVLMAP